MAIEIGDTLFFKTTKEPCVVLDFPNEVSVKVRRPVVLGQNEVAFKDDVFYLFELQTYAQQQEDEGERKLVLIERELKLAEKIVALKAKYPGAQQILQQQAIVN